MPGIRNPFETLSFLPKKKSFGGNSLYGDTLEEIRRRSAYPGIDPLAPERREYLVDDRGQDRETEAATPKRDWSGYLKDLKEIYSKPGSAQSAYESHLANIPQQGKPTVWGRIVAGIVGAGTGYTEGPSKGIAAGQAVYRRPYERQLEEWQNKEAGLSRQAEIEEKNLGRRLGYMKEVREVAKDQDDYDAKMREYDLKEEAQADLARYRDAQIEELKGRGWTTLPPNAAGETRMYNPRTQEERNLGKALAGAQFEETKRHQGVTEKQGWDASRRGWANVNLGKEAGQRAETGLTLQKEAGGRAQSALEIQQAQEGRARAGFEAGPHIQSTEQAAATKLAAAQVVAEYPDAAKFIDEKGGIKPPTITGEYGTETEDKAHFARFMQEVERKKREALGLRRPGPAVGGLSGSSVVPRGSIEQ